MINILGKWMGRKLVNEKYATIWTCDIHKQLRNIFQKFCSVPNYEFIELEEQHVKEIFHLF